MVFDLCRRLLQVCLTLLEGCWWHLGSDVGSESDNFAKRQFVKNGRFVFTKRSFLRPRCVQNGDGYRQERNRERNCRF